MSNNEIARLVLLFLTVCASFPLFHSLNRLQVTGTKFLPRLLFQPIETLGSRPSLKV